MKNDNVAYLSGEVGQGTSKPEAPALEVCYRQVIGQAQDITLRTYLPSDAPLEAFNATLDKMGAMSNRLTMKRELDALLAEKEREAQTLQRLETNEAQTRMDEERKIASERVKHQEMVKTLDDERRKGLEAHEAKGRAGSYIAKGATASRINATMAAIQKQEALVKQLEEDFAANRKNYQTNLAAWKAAQDKYEKDIAALKAAL